MKSALTFLLLLLLFNSCTTSEEPISPDVVQPSTSDNVYDEFNHWVYYQMNEQYLWREDLPDSLDCDYNLPPKEFFESLLSDKDRFSYFTTNQSYKGSRSTTNSNRFGFEYQTVQAPNGNQWLYVLYVYDNYAKQMGIKRGDILKQVSCGVFRKAHIVGNEIKGLASQEIKLGFNDGIEKNSVLLDSIYYIDNKSIGYLCYLEYSDVEDLIEPLTKFASLGIDELILDLRYNPGGYVSTCKYLCNCIVQSRNYGNIVQIFSYNDRISKKNLFETGSEFSFSYFNELSQSGEEVLGEYSIIPLELDKITVITSSHTASASEATIVCLKPYINVVSIGEQTVGKGVGSWLISDSKYRYAIQPITLRYYNALMETTPEEGIMPDVYVGGGYSVSVKEIGDINELLLNIAIAHIKGETLQAELKTYSPNLEIDYSLTPVGEPS